jgi:hypothetical protein
MNATILATLNAISAKLTTAILLQMGQRDLLRCRGPGGR